MPLGDFLNDLGGYYKSGFETSSNLMTLGLADQFRTANRQRKEGMMNEMLALPNRPMYEDALTQTQTYTGQVDELSQQNLNQLRSDVEGMRETNQMLSNQGLPQESLDFYTDQLNRSLGAALTGGQSRRAGTAGLAGVSRGVLDSYRDVMTMDANQRLQNRQAALEREAGYASMLSNAGQQNIANRMATGQALAGEMGQSEMINEIDWFNRQLDFARQKQMAGDMNRMGAWGDVRNYGTQLGNTAIQGQQALFGPAQEAAGSALGLLTGGII